jgi:hypothetical protein
MQNIESELKERLKKGVYGDIYNVPFKEFDEVLDMERDEVVLEEEDEEVSIVLNTCKPSLFLSSQCSPALSFVFA